VVAWETTRRVVTPTPGLAPIYTAANVTVTAASGGLSISADTNGTNGTGAYTALGAITIAESGTGKGDFAAGNGQTLILTAPSGFQFDTTSVPTVSFVSGANITSADASFSS